MKGAVRDEAFKIGRNYLRLYIRATGISFSENERRIVYVYAVARSNSQHQRPI